MHLSSSSSTRTWRKKIRYLLFTLLFCILSGIFALGILFAAELLYRALTKPTGNQVIEVNLFPYSHFLVHTQPQNVTLGVGKSILDNYCPHDLNCDEPGGVTCKFNSLGFRSPEFTDLPAKSPNEIRIVITGGSASISWGIGEQCTLDRRLEAGLKAQFPDKTIRIFNLGNSAWISFQELIAIQLYGLEIQPDLVISFDGFNDIEHSFFSPINRVYAAGHIETAFKRYKSWVEAKPFDFMKQFRIALGVKDWFSRRPDRIRTLQSDYPEFAKEAKPGAMGTRLAQFPIDMAQVSRHTDFDPYLQKVVENYTKNLRLMAASLQTIGAHLLCVLQPSLFNKNPAAPKEEKTLWENYFPEVNYVALGYVRAADQLKILESTQPNVAFLDLSRPFEGKSEEFFLDNCHFNSIGYQIVAEKLVPAVESLLAKKE